MREPYRSLLPRLEEATRRELTRHPECHGWDHTMRVWHNARHLAEAEKADAAVAEFAALLHDIARTAEDRSRGRACHAALGARRAPAILRGLGVADESFILHVAACIATHRYRARDAGRPATLEARIVFDADKLDSLGAIGIGRAFHFAGRVGARVHNTREEALAGQPYTREDTAYREFLVKLSRLRGCLLTCEGRRVAAARHRFMARFFAQLQLEADGRDRPDRSGRRRTRTRARAPTIVPGRE